MRICIDIDGTICEIRRPEQAYADVSPLPGAADKIRDLRRRGHYVILATARHMQTCGANVGLVLARQGQTLFKWLEAHGFEYDEIWFGKPNADLYLDDRAHRFTGDWSNIGVAPFEGEPK